MFEKLEGVFKQDKVAGPKQNGKRPLCGAAARAAILAGQDLSKVMNGVQFLHKQMLACRAPAKPAARHIRGVMRSLKEDAMLCSAGHSGRAQAKGQGAKGHATTVRGCCKGCNPGRARSHY